MCERVSECFTLLDILDDCIIELYGMPLLINAYFKLCSNVVEKPNFGQELRISIRDKICKCVLSQLQAFDYL